MITIHSDLKKSNLKERCDLKKKRGYFGWVMLCVTYARVGLVKNLGKDVVER